MNSDHAASLIAFASERLFTGAALAARRCMFLTAKVSPPIDKEPKFPAIFRSNRSDQEVNVRAA